MHYNKNGDYNTQVIPETRVHSKLGKHNSTPRNKYNLITKPGCKIFHPWILQLSLVVEPKESS